MALAVPRYTCVSLVAYQPIGDANRQAGAIPWMESGSLVASQRKGYEDTNDPGSQPSISSHNADGTPRASNLADCSPGDQDTRPDCPSPFGGPHAMWRSARNVAARTGPIAESACAARVGSPAVPRGRRGTLPRTRRSKATGPEAPDLRSSRRASEDGFLFPATQIHAAHATQPATLRTPSSEGRLLGSSGGGTLETGNDDISVR